ncbi:hypothetical protein ACFYUY_36515 [Kitasatospora sp. NPDC004745]|uniref:hypothetical protein n=1 Tax=Kitasatospora sp. NPDC004745 TaxID=3364019 RepID=UPI00368FE421
MSRPEEFEDDLLYAMTRTGEGFRTEPADLVAGGYRRGRSRWRRRSTAAVLGGAAALALVGTGTLYLTGSAGPAPVRAAAAPSPAAGSGSGTPSVAPSAPATSAASPAVKPVGGDEVLAAFQALLPKGQVTDGRGTGTEPADGKPWGGGVAAGASLVFDDGRGRSAMGISLGRLGEGDPGRAENTCPDGKLVPYDACTTTTLPGGGTLTVLQGYEYPDKRATTKWWNAKLIGADGRQIELSEWNSPAEKGSPDSRPQPPLSAEQLKAVVTDASWDRVIAAIPVPAPVKPRDTSHEYGQEEILAIAAKLLPAGLTEAKTGGQPGYANFVVDDGRGESLVEINVQDWSGGKSPAGEIFDGVAPQPDGTKVVVRKQAGNPAGWIVDTLHADGLRVVVAAYNSGSQRTKATRSTAALSDDQLKAIATAAVWKLKK